MSGRVGVAISTTGHEHRLGFLETSARYWWQALVTLGLPTTVYVTVDGTEEDTLRVAERVAGFAEVYQVGQIDPGWGIGPVDGLIGDRLGVAANKNTGLELLMDTGGTDSMVEHLFLSDDDTWPLGAPAIRAHVNSELPHSMVCWGGHRLDPVSGRSRFAHWTWPRGVVLYQTRAVVERVGGMDERFGPGGHEHVEYSRRVHLAGFTPAPFVSPAAYGMQSPLGAATGAASLWHCEDMRRPGETHAALGARRKALTSISRTERDWDSINKIMDEREGNSDFVSFRAHENGRGSATLSSNLTSRGAEGQA